MANANAPRGLLPYRHYDGSVWNGSANVYYVNSSYATSLFIGDPVISNHSDNDANGIPAVRLATAGGASTPVLGVVVGIVNAGNPPITVTRDLPIYRPASTAQYILVADDPTLLFMVQDDGTGSSQSGWSSQNASLVSGTGSTVTGYSGWQLGGSTVNTTSTLQVRILRPLDQTDNVVGTGGANAKWLVKFNFHQMLLSTGT